MLRIAPIQPPPTPPFPPPASLGNWSKSVLSPREFTLSQADKMAVEIAERIDADNLTDYEFRNWLRDYLCTCEYITPPDTSRYTSPPRPAPISVLDALLPDTDET